MALTIALIGLFIYFLCKRDYLIIFVLFLSIAIFSQSIITLKPPLNIQTTSQISRKNILSDEHSNDLLSIQTSTDKQILFSGLNTLAAANNDRLNLLKQSLYLIPRYSLLGSGPGTLSVPLSGTILGGIKSTYSSHSLIIDIFLMGGGLSILSLFIFLFCFFSASSNLDHYQFNPFQLLVKAALFYFFVGALFFPQERNEIVTLAFIVASTAFKGHNNQFDHSSSTSGFKYFLSLFNFYASSIVFFFFSVLQTALLSPVYFFPTLELLSRYRHFIEKSDYVFYTNKFAFDAALPLYQFLGYDLSKIKLVSANLAQQDVSSSLVVLTPGFSSNYPTLFTKISSSPLLPTLIGTYIPYDWSILPSFQQSTPLIYTGPLENYYSQPSDKTHNTSHLCSSPIQHDSTTSFVPRFEYPSVSRLSIFDGYNISSSGQKIHNYESIYAGDGLDTSIARWPSSGRFVLDVKLPLGLDKRPISSYSLLASHSSDFENIECYSWFVYGINKKHHAILLDKRINFPLSQDVSSPSYFSLSAPIPFTHLKFVFLETTNSELLDNVSGIASLKLFPSDPF